MIVIIEGIDRVGKSTLRDMLISKGFEYIESYISQDTALCLYNQPEYMSLAYRERILAQTDVLMHLPKHKNYVMDRFHVSQYAYSLAFRNFHDDLMFTVDEILATLPVLMVYVYPTDINESCENDGRDLHRVFNIIDDFRVNIEKCPTIKCTYETLQFVADKLGGNDG